MTRSSFVGKGFIMDLAPPWDNVQAGQTPLHLSCFKLSLFFEMIEDTGAMSQEF